MVLKTVVSKYQMPNYMRATERTFKRKKYKLGRKIGSIVSIRQRVYGSWNVENVAGVLTNTSDSAETSFANFNFAKDQTGNQQFISYGIGFQLTDIPGYSRFVLLFEKYRLKKIVLKIFPPFTSTSGGDVVNNVLGAGAGMTMSTYDYDDNVAEDSLVDFMQREKAIIKDGVKAITLTVIPRVTTSLQESGGAQKSAEQQISPWIDSGEADMVHYGAKFAFNYALDPIQANNKIAVRVLATYYIDFKDLHYDN